MAQAISEVDWTKVEEMTLALMHLTTFEEYGSFRSWKGLAWEILERLHERGWIASPLSKASLSL